MNKRQQEVKKILSNAKKLGLDLKKITEGKTIETLARSIKTIENLKKRFARQKERPKILQEVKKIDEKIRQNRVEREKKKAEEKLKDFRRNMITDEIKSELKWNHNVKVEDINKKTLKTKTNNALDDFFNRYFKEIKNNNESKKLINKMKKRFGVRLDLAYQFMEYVSEMEFKYEIPKEIMKTDTPKAYNKMLHERLEYFERVIGREFNI